MKGKKFFVWYGGVIGLTMTKISEVTVQSPAQQAGIHAGDILCSINGHEIVDVLDYRFYSYDANLTLTLENETGKQYTVHVEKQDGEELGLSFEHYLMDNARPCANHCVFCFVDQMPKGMRESLYFKDDDARLSFLMGNYLTLTNLSAREIARIIDLKISPINVSVHTTDPDLRVKMLGHRRAGESIETMKRFSQHGITMNCQIVACPGWNDGAQLQRTMEDLAQMHPSVHSVSVVPVGLTKFREGLNELRPYTKQEAGEVIDMVETFAQAHLQAHGTRLIWCSDEFYLLAGRPLHEEAFFEGYCQFENGVGMVTSLKAEFQRALALLDADEMKGHTPFAIATGTAAAPFMKELVEMAKRVYPQLEGQVYAIKNDFFGRTVDVAGLVTAGDMIAQLKDKPLPQKLFISSNMLRAGENVFLDDYTTDDVQRILQVEITSIAQDGYALCDAMFGMLQENLPHEGNLEDTEYYQYNPPSHP